MSDELKQRAAEIRDETEQGANTAERVGGLLVNMVSECDQIAKNTVDVVENQEDLEKRVEALEKKVNTLSTEIGCLIEKLSEFMGFTYISAIEIPPKGGGAVLGVKTICKEWEVE